MGSAAQAEAVKNYRMRLKQSGMTRIHVIGLSSDRKLVRNIARKLAGGSEEAAQIRESLAALVVEKTVTGVGIREALRRWQIEDF